MATLTVVYLLFVLGYKLHDSHLQLHELQLLQDSVDVKTAC